jgi:hypothetical protein
MREPAILKVGRNQAVERDPHQQIDVELGEDTQCVARTFRSEFLPSTLRSADEGSP